MIDNPAFKGKWHPPQIPNPDFQGIWKPRMIPNPEYFEDNEPYKMTPIVSCFSHFDNLHSNEKSTFEYLEFQLIILCFNVGSV